MTEAVAGIEGVRIAQGSSESSNGNVPQIGVAVTPAAGPPGEDQTLLERGIAVFVDPDIAPMLDGKCLDVASAVPDQVRFALIDQLP